MPSFRKECAAKEPADRGNRSGASRVRNGGSLRKVSLLELSGAFIVVLSWRANASRPGDQVPKVEVVVSSRLHFLSLALGPD